MRQAPTVRVHVQLSGWEHLTCGGCGYQKPARELVRVTKGKGAADEDPQRCGECLEEGR